MNVVDFFLLFMFLLNRDLAFLLNLHCFSSELQIIYDWTLCVDHPFDSVYVTDPEISKIIYSFEIIFLLSFFKLINVLSFLLSHFFLYQSLVKPNSEICFVLTHFFRFNSCRQTHLLTSRVCSSSHCGFSISSLHFSFQFL